MKHICPDIDLSSKPCSYYLKEGSPGFCSHPDHFRCIEYIRLKEPILSYSYIGTYKACLREFMFKWLLGYKLTNPNINSEVSSIFHLFMEAWYSGKAKPMIKAETKLAELWKRFPVEFDAPNELKTVGAVANAYYSIKRKGIEKVRTMCKTEDRITAFNDGYTLKNIIDMILDDRKTGYEWKYVKNPDIYGRFTMRLQLACYFLARPDLESVVVRTITKPDNYRIKQAKKEGLLEYQQRVERTFIAQKNKNIVSKQYYRVEFDIKRLEQEIRLISKEIQERIDGQTIALWWQNQNCCYFSGIRNFPCDYLPACEADVMPGKLPEIYKKINIERKMEHGK